MDKKIIIEAVQSYQNIIREAVQMQIQAINHLSYKLTEEEREELERVIFELELLSTCQSTFIVEVTLK